MTLRMTNRAAAAALTLLLAAGATAAHAQQMTLRFGILAGLTGDPAPSGQAWNESAKLATESDAAAIVTFDPGEGWVERVSECAARVAPGVRLARVGMRYSDPRGHPCRNRPPVLAVKS